MISMSVLGAGGEMAPQVEAPTGSVAERAEAWRAINSLPAKANNILYTAPPQVQASPPPTSKAGWPMWAKVGAGLAGLAVVIAIVR